MEHRMTALETRIDTILPTLATKADVLATKADILATKADILATKADVAALQARLDTILPTLATKADLEALALVAKADVEALALSTSAKFSELRAEMQEMNANIKTWAMAMMITMVGTMLAAVIGITQFYKGAMNVVPAAQYAPPNIRIPGAFAPSSPSILFIIASSPAGSMPQST
jgi:hypothetical protein